MAAAIEAELPRIAEAVDKVAERFARGGRIIYCGAGTSGRLGTLDAVELTPTYNVSPHQAFGLLAGGEGAMYRSVEGAEDSRELAVEDLKRVGLTEADCVIGVAASGRTPYTLSALTYANCQGALSISVTCNGDSPMAEEAEISIAPIVGPEVICGSTRMKAGTAQKMVLNMISTAVMIREGVQGVVAPWAHRRLEAGMLYDLASVTKVVGTTTRILQMIQEGRLSLFTPVSWVLGQFRYPDITVEHLLLHNSGLPAEVRDKRTLTRDNILPRLFETEPESLPGERFCYSDPGYMLLGLMIKALDGESLEAVMGKAIFSPLKMRQTSYHPKADIERFVPEEYTQARGMICGEVHDSKAYLLGESGSAGLFSTLEDLMVFARALTRRDDRLFRREIFELLDKVEVYGRTLGWSVEYGPYTLYHTGFTGTSILIDMEKRESFILLTNRIHPTRDNSRFLEWRKRLNQMWLEGIGDCL